MKIEKATYNNIPLMIYGADSDRVFLYVHGRFSKKEEAESFSLIAINEGYQVLAFDLPEHGERINENYKCTAKNGKADLLTIMDFVTSRWNNYSLYACSLGAYFSLLAYGTIKFDKVLFVSPILNMKQLIENMMKGSNVSAQDLELRGEIETSFGEVLSWEYYLFVRQNPIMQWNSVTSILYGENDNLTEKSILNEFAEKYNSKVTVIKSGEHYIQKEEHLKILNNWIKQEIKSRLTAR
jgi:uncharacterized protein